MTWLDASIRCCSKQHLAQQQGKTIPTAPLHIAHAVCKAHIHIHITDKFETLGLQHHQQTSYHSLVLLLLLLLLP